MAETTEGSLEGVIAANGVAAFLGIRYGVVAARFRPAVRAAAPAAHAAADFGPSCPQLPVSQRYPPEYVENDRMRASLEAYGGIRLFEPVQAEDCLVLNIWTPGPDRAGRPVVVWVHAGSPTYGSGSWPNTDGADLAATADVVVVTMNYRLGVLGYSGIDDDADDVGLLDMLAALRWLGENISQFGGDPGAVALCGVSGGATTVLTLLATGRLNGLVQRAILQSPRWPRYHDGPFARAQAAELQSAAGAAGVGRIEDIPCHVLLELVSAHRFQFPPVVGGLVPRDPIAAIEAGVAASIPIVVGVTAGESFEWARSTQALWFAHPGPSVLDAYRQYWPGHSGIDLELQLHTDLYYNLFAATIAAAQCRAGGDAYVYRLTADILMGSHRTTPHGADVVFVFGNWDAYTRARPTDRNRRLRRVVASLWGQFAQSGSFDGGPVVWPRFETDVQAYLELSADHQQAVGFLGDRLDFLREHSPGVLVVSEHGAAPGPTGPMVGLPPD